MNITAPEKKKRGMRRGLGGREVRRQANPGTPGLGPEVPSLTLHEVLVDLDALCCITRRLFPLSQTGVGRAARHREQDAGSPRAQEVWLHERKGVFLRGYTSSVPCTRTQTTRTTTSVRHEVEWNTHDTQASDTATVPSSRAPKRHARPTDPSCKSHVTPPERDL